ncbi:hypothetical protein DL95DRAFT_467953 [Leptodontidium sp. 2 PMI_412]|nr:hypothetical protein DL95DRAFT_467953 [Leptodontidium sp. 2 PMI_412]
MRNLRSIVDAYSLHGWTIGLAASRVLRSTGFGLFGALQPQFSSAGRNKGRSNRGGPWSSPYIPMLLSCKIISAECLQSIYESTTFIFTDFRALQIFFGYCANNPALKKLPEMPTPPAFFKYTRSLELSLSPDFPKHLLCANIDLPGIERRHEVYDFHWLRLDQFENLKRVNIWIASRSISCRVDSNNSFRGIKEFDFEELRKLLTPFKNIKSFTMSTPLGPSVGLEEGIVKGVISSGELDRVFDGLIYTSPTREVRLARNGGDHDLMKEV